MASKRTIAAAAETVPMLGLVAYAVEARDAVLGPPTRARPKNGKIDSLAADARCGSASGRLLCTSVAEPTPRRRRALRSRFKRGRETP
jgi:hypothetical protein